MGAPAIPLNIPKADLSKVTLGPLPDGKMECVPVILLNGKPIVPAKGKRA